MNLYIFSETRRGSVYGVGTYIFELTSALKNSSVKICMVYLMSKKPLMQSEEIDGILHWYFPSIISEQRTISTQKQWELYYRNIVYLLRLYIKDKKDLIFHLNYCQSSTLVEELKNAFVCKVITVVHFSGWGFTVYDNLERLRSILKKEYPDSFEEDLQKSFENEKSLYLKVDRIICMSDYMRELLCHDYEIDANKISVVPHGLYDVTDTDTTISISSLRKKWDIRAKEKIILFAGRIDEIKGVVYLVRAFREVLKKNRNCRLIIAGSGNYDLCFQETKDIFTKVIFTGLLDKKDLNEIYQIANVGVVPSLFEPFGYVAVEMMMHKLPVVVTETSGLNEVIDKTCGLKMPITVLSDNVGIDAAIMSEKILYLLQNPIEAKKMGRNGRKRYLHNYSSEVFRFKMLETYKLVNEFQEKNKIKTLVVTGQHNHNWEVSHIAIKEILENSGLFAVDTAVSPKTGEQMFNFKPNFASYQLVVLDYNGDRWPEETDQSFLDFIEKGGGVVVYHAANNAFRHWKEYNQIIGLGGWGDRNETDGSYIYLREGGLVYDNSPGHGGSHGSQHEFVLHCGNPYHPITKGLPTAWRHAQDELYDCMRGPGVIKDILFWAYSDPETKGSGRDELAIFTVDYGSARIFHTTLGHAGNSLDDNIAMQCAGFQTILLRGAEWAATGQVTQQVPDDFPTATTLSMRKNYRTKTS